MIPAQHVCETVMILIVFLNPEARRACARYESQSSEPVIPTSISGKRLMAGVMAHIDKGGSLEASGETPNQIQNKPDRTQRQGNASSIGDRLRCEHG